MTQNTILRRWLALKNGEGLHRIRRVSTTLSLAALGLCFLVVYGSMNDKFSPWVVAALSVPIGWLIAERNALDERARLWPLFSKYIDWSRVEQDVQYDRTTET